MNNTMAKDNGYTARHYKHGSLRRLEHADGEHAAECQSFDRQRLGFGCHARGASALCYY